MFEAGIKVVYGPRNCLGKILGNQDYRRVKLNLTYLKDINVKTTDIVKSILKKSSVHKSIIPSPAKTGDVEWTSIPACVLARIFLECD